MPHKTSTSKQLSFLVTVLKKVEPCLTEAAMPSASPPTDVSLFVQVGDVKLQLRVPHFILDSRTAPVRKSSALVVAGTPDCSASSPSPQPAAAANGASVATTAGTSSAAAASGGGGGVGPASEARRSRLLVAEAGQCVQEKLVANTTLLRKVMSGIDATDVAAAKHTELVVPQGMNGEQVKELLGKYDKEQWLHFSNVTQVFTRFSSEVLQQQFQGMLQAIIVPWCCRNYIEVVEKMGLPQKHWHVIRPWGSPQKTCIRNDGAGSVSYFCDA